MSQLLEGSSWFVEAAHRFALRGNSMLYKHTSLVVQPTHHRLHACVAGIRISYKLRGQDPLETRKRLLQWSLKERCVRTETRYIWLCKHSTESHRHWSPVRCDAMQFSRQGPMFHEVRVGCLSSVVIGKWELWISEQNYNNEQYIWTRPAMHV